MPKTKKKSKARNKKIRRKQNRPRLGLYLLAALVSIVIMWALIREPKPAPQDLQELISKEIVKRSTKVPKPHKTSKEQEQTQAQQSAEPEKAETTEIEEPPKPRAGEHELDLVIRSAAEKLGVPERATRRRKTDTVIRYSVPIDRSQMDLTYANMIFKGELERAGATLISGIDNRNKQSISFSCQSVPTPYQLDIYYDSSIYQSKVNPQTITIVVDDFGAISGSLLDGFFALDQEVCFAIFPEEEHSVQTMQRATRQGRETLIHVPMEPIGYPRVNPGNNAILVQHSAAHINRTLSQFIDILPDCIGINNHMGSFATTDIDIMQAVMNTLKEHGKAFLDSRTTNVSVGYQTAQKSHIRAFRNDIFLDSPNISQSTMEAKLNRIIQLSRGQNHIIAITHCHTQDKLEYLQTFISRLKKAGFRLIPLSEAGDYKVPEIL
jgi:polysaccharide deacetylase 2 family uncharacterized protein YibQ